MSAARKTIEDVPEIGEAIRWIELAGWLHNFGKMRPKFVFALDNYRKWISEPDDVLNKETALLTKLQSTFVDTKCSLMSCTVLELIENFLDKNPVKPLIALMGACHREASAYEKRSEQRERIETLASQPLGRIWDPRLRAQLETKTAGQDAYPRFGLTSFGHPILTYPSQSALEDLERQAIQTIIEFLDDFPVRHDWSILDRVLRHGPADSKLPIADVTIADMGRMVAALMKAEVVRSFLSQDENPRRVEDLKWQLMRVAVDGPAFRLRASRLADSLARSKVLQTSIQQMVTMVEDELLFGNRVYEDEFGPCFLITGDCLWNAEVETRIQRAWEDTEAAREGQIAVQFSKSFAAGSSHGYAHQLGKLLTLEAPPAAALLKTLSADWNDAGPREICPTCNLRPIGPKEGARRKQCVVCGNWRGGRVRDWLAGRDRLTNLERTIWLEELGDENGRLAMISARFRLEPWLLEGGYLASTCFLAQPNEAGDRFNIAPSSARTRRLTECAREFWEETESAVLAHLPRLQRRVLQGSCTSQPEINSVYSLIHLVHMIRISAVWTGDSFLVVENVEWLKRLLVQESGVKEAENFFKQGTQFKIETPSSYQSPERSSTHSLIGTFTVDRVWVHDTMYSPYLQLTLSPRTFECVSPARSATRIVSLLVEKFGAEMGRVQDRLGLDLTLIVSDTSTPFRAVLDAARRAQSRRPARQEWSVSDVQLERPLSPRASYVHFANNVSRTVPLAYDIVTQFEKTQNFKDLPRSTPDDYFPYLTLSNGRLVHARDLNSGDTVVVEPSTFDFEFLDSASRRFEFSYSQDTNQRRALKDPAEDRSHRPFPVELVPGILDAINELGDRFSTRQLKILDCLLASRQGEWQKLRNELPDTFIDDVLRNLEPLPGRHGLTRGERQNLIWAVQRGLLQDAIEIYLGIRKGREAE